jgi:hypothetical protein
MQRTISQNRGKPTSNGFFSSALAAFHSSPSRLPISPKEASGLSAAQSHRLEHYYIARMDRAYGTFDRVQKIPTLPFQAYGLSAANHRRYKCYYIRQTKCVHKTAYKRCSRETCSVSISIQCDGATYTCIHNYRSHCALPGTTCSIFATVCFSICNNFS